MAQLEEGQRVYALKYVNNRKKKVQLFGSGQVGTKSVPPPNELEVDWPNFRIDLDGMADVCWEAECYHIFGSENEGKQWLDEHCPKDEGWTYEEVDSKIGDHPHS